MYDQLEIIQIADSWMRSKASADVPMHEIRAEWEQFAASHDKKTAEALRQSSYFEACYLIMALMEAVLNKIRTKVPMDERITEDIRTSGSPSFTGDRAEVRELIDVMSEYLHEEATRRINDHQ